jgi:hypothetical protein
MVLAKVRKIATKNFFGQLTFVGKVIDFWVIDYIGVKNFLHNMELLSIKRSRILRRYQKY